MHPIKRLGCRAFQFAFRAALPLLPYRQPKKLDSLMAVPGILLEQKVVSALLIADGSVRDLGLTAALEQALHAAGISFSLYEQRLPNPTIENVEAARRLYLACGARAVIAVGGGSAIDCAKAVCARIARPDKTVQRMRGILRILRKTPLLIAAPTTAGTGSETTVTAVITDSSAHHKYPINDFVLIPDYAVLDAKLTLDLPPYFTAITGMDALTHAIEAYIGRSTNAFTRAMAEEAVTLIAQNLIAAYDDGSNLKARKGMLKAAHYAGIAFTRSYVGYVHAVAHSLGGQYGIAHGLANSVILPHVLRAYGDSCSRKLAALSRCAGVSMPYDDDASASQAFINWIDGLNHYFGLPESFHEIRIGDIPAMAAHADQEANPLYPVPKLMDQRELETIYELLIPKEDIP